MHTSMHSKQKSVAEENEAPLLLENFSDPQEMALLNKQCGDWGDGSVDEALAPQV